MKCATCGKEIGSTDRRVHYCSDECRSKSVKAQMIRANKKRRETNPEYLKKTYANNLRRYHVKKHERFIEIAKELNEHAGDIEAMTKVLEDSCRLRH